MFLPASEPVHTPCPIPPHPLDALPGLHPSLLQPMPSEFHTPPLQSQNYLLPSSLPSQLFWRVCLLHTTSLGMYRGDSLFLSSTLGLLQKLYKHPGSIQISAYAHFSEEHSCATATWPRGMPLHVLSGTWQIARCSHAHGSPAQLSYCLYF